MAADPATPRVFVAITVHNRREFTRQCLAALARQTFRQFSVVLVDDGSTDGTSEMVQAESPDTRLLTGDGSLWWSGGTNRAVRYALEQGATTLVCLNDDTRPRADWLERLLETSAQKPGAIVGCAALDAASGDVCFSGERVRWLSADYEPVPTLAQGGQRVVEVTHAPGRGLLVPAAVFAAIGLFDERRFPQAGADYDFTLRARRAGIAVLCDRAALIEMHPEASGDAAFRASKSWANYRRHLFDRRGGGNLARFVRFAWRNCPPALLPVHLAAGLVRRLGGFLLEWATERRTRPAGAGPRVLLVTNFAPQYRVGLFESLARLCRLRCVFYSDGGEWYWQKQRTLHAGAFDSTYLRGFWLGRLRVAPGLLPRLFTTPADVMVKCINNRHVLLATYLAARLRRVPFVLWTGVWCRLSTPHQRRAWPLALYLYRHVDAVVAYGEHVRRYLISEGVAAERIFLAPQAVDNARFARPVSAAEHSKLNARLGLTPAEPMLLAVGRLEPVKGLDVLLDAFATLAHSAVLVLCGSGGLDQALRAQAERLGIAARVRLMGDIEPAELVVYYSRAWAVVLPSVTTPGGREAWGLVANEAFNQGVPLVASDAVGAAAGGLVRHLETGLVVPEGNRPALAEALARMLNETGLRQRLGENARREVESWTQDRMAAGFSAAIAHALSQRARAKAVRT